MSRAEVLRIERALEDEYGPIAPYRPRKNSFVYFIQANDGTIKVGVAQNPVARLADLQVAHAYGLELLVTIPGGRKLELEIHKRFRHKRLLGEWFLPSPDLISYIQTLRSTDV